MYMGGELELGGFWLTIFAAAIQTLSDVKMEKWTWFFPHSPLTSKKLSTPPMVSTMNIDKMEYCTLPLELFNLCFLSSDFGILCLISAFLRLTSSSLAASSRTLA